MIHAHDGGDGLLDTFGVPGVSAAHLLCDRHPGENIAFTVTDANLVTIDVTYSELREKCARFAAALSSLGVRRGDHVATLMGKSVELLIAVLGMWRLEASNVPVPTGSTHEQMALHLQSSGARLVICDAEHRRKLLPQGGIPNDASPLVVVARGEAFGYDVAFSEMAAGTGAFARDGAAPEQEI